MTSPAIIVTPETHCKDAAALLIRCRTRSAAASLQCVSGVTVMAGDVIASFALMLRA